MPEDAPSSVHNLLQKLVAGLTEPLAALSAFHSVVFILLVTRLDFDKERSMYVLYVFVVVVLVLTTAILIYQRGLSSSQTHPKMLEELEQYRRKIFDLQEEQKTLRDRLEMSQKVRNWKDWEQWIDIRSIDTDLDVPDRFRDKDHKFTDLLFRGTVDLEGNYQGRYTRRGYRHTEGFTDHMFFRVGASFPIRSASDLGLQVKDLTKKVVLNTTIFEDADHISKVFKIELAKPLAKGDEFNVEISFFWPKCIVARRDTDTLNLSQFTLGVDKLRHELVLPFNPHGTILYEVNNSDVKRSMIEVKHRPSKEMHMLTYEVSHPQVQGYVLGFSVPQVQSTNVDAVA